MSLGLIPVTGAFLESDEWLGLNDNNGNLTDSGWGEAAGSVLGLFKS